MDNYSDNLRKVKSLLIATSLQKREDIKASKFIEEFSDDLEWQPLANLMIDADVWNYVTTTRNYNPKLVFCHPKILMAHPITSLYYRCLCGLSIKSAEAYFGAIKNLERGNTKIKLKSDKAVQMARTYNFFICSIIKGSTDWSLENGKRTIIATMGISLDGVMRNKVGEIAEDRIRGLILEWAVNKDLIVSVLSENYMEDIPTTCELKDGIIMKFSSEPDISFFKGSSPEDLIAIVEIKGGIDPAGALERYGAATKSFQHALNSSSRCKNFFLSAVFTPELERRIQNDRYVEKYFDIIEILENYEVRNIFFEELFHYTLRIG